MSMEPFHFLRPEWLLALIPLTLALWLMYRRKGQAGNWRSVCDPALLPYLMIEEKAKKASRALPLIGLAGLLAILALSGPSWRQMEQPLFRGEGSLVILLDLSRSMEATDIKPSRVARARYELLDILRKRREGQTALIVYAAQPFVVSPLTDDTRTIASLVNSLTTDIMPSQGSRPDLALGKGIELLKQAGSASGDLLFISDGLSNEALTRTLAARPQGYPVSVLAMGTSQGAPIPLAGGGFLKNLEGDIVISRLRETQLRRLATESGGRFSYLSADDRDIDSLLSQFDVEKSDEFDEKSAPLSSLWRDEGPWLVLLLLPLAALAFRRGYLLLVVFLSCPCPLPPMLSTGTASGPDRTSALPGPWNQGPRRKQRINSRTGSGRPPPTTGQALMRKRSRHSKEAPSKTGITTAAMPWPVSDACRKRSRPTTGHWNCPLKMKMPVTIGSW